MGRWDMGLSIGSVQINYFKEPQGAAGGFVSYLVDNMYDIHEDGWGFEADGNVLVQYTLDNMLDRLNSYGKSAGLSDDEKAEVLEWVRGLPWRDYTVMLYMGW